MAQEARLGPVVQDELPGLFYHCLVCNVIHLKHLRPCHQDMTVFKRKCEMCGSHHRWYPASHKSRKDGGRRCMDKLTDYMGNVCARYCSRCHHVVSRAPGDTRTSLQCPRCKIGATRNSQEGGKRKRGEAEQPSCPDSPEEGPVTVVDGGYQSPAPVPMPAMAPAPLFEPSTPTTQSWDQCSGREPSPGAFSGYAESDEESIRKRARHVDEGTDDLARILFEMEMARSFYDFSSFDTFLSGLQHYAARPAPGAAAVPVAAEPMSVVPAYHPEAPVTPQDAMMMPSDIADDILNQLLNQSEIPSTEITNGDISCYLNEDYNPACTVSAMMASGSAIDGATRGSTPARGSDAAVADDAVKNLARVFDSLQEAEPDKAAQSIKVYRKRIAALKARALAGASVAELEDELASLRVEVEALSRDALFAARPAVRSPISVVVRRRTDSGEPWNNEEVRSDVRVTGNRDKLALLITHNGGVTSAPLQIVAMVHTPSRGRTFTSSVIPLRKDTTLRNDCSAVTLKPGETLDTSEVALSPEIDEETGYETRYISVFFRDPTNAPSEEEPADGDDTSESERDDGCGESEALGGAEATADSGWRYVSRRYACQFVRA